MPNLPSVSGLQSAQCQKCVQGECKQWQPVKGGCVLCHGMVQ